MSYSVVTGYHTYKVVSKSMSSDSPSLYFTLSSLSLAVVIVVSTTVLAYIFM